MLAATCAAGSWLAQRAVAQRVGLITPGLGHAACTSVLHLVAACSLLNLVAARSAQDCAAQGHFHVLWFLRRAACTPRIEQQCGQLPPGLLSPGSLPFAVGAGGIMGILACTAGRGLA
jgi:hypothetical protein